MDRGSALLAKVSKVSFGSGPFGDAVDTRLAGRVSSFRPATASVRRAPARRRRAGRSVRERPGSRHGVHRSGSARRRALEDGDVSSVLAGPVGSVVNNDLGVSLNTTGIPGRKALSQAACEGARNSVRHVVVPARNSPGPLDQRPYLHEVWWFPKGSSR